MRFLDFFYDAIVNALAVWDATPWQMQLLLVYILLYEYFRAILHEFPQMSPFYVENTKEEETYDPDLYDWEEVFEDDVDEIEEIEDDLTDPKKWVEDQLREIYLAHGLQDPTARKTGS